jgi:hypothetical protein
VLSPAAITALQVRVVWYDEGLRPGLHAAVPTGLPKRATSKSVSEAMHSLLAYASGCDGEHQTNHYLLETAARAWPATGMPDQPCAGVAGSSRVQFTRGRSKPRNRERGDPIFVGQIDRANAVVVRIGHVEFAGGVAQSGGFIESAGGAIVFA